MSIKAIYNFRNKLNEQGKAQIYICVSHKKQRKYVNTQFYIEPRYWDDKKERVKPLCPQSQIINQKISQIIYGLEQKETELINTGRPYTVADFFVSGSASLTFPDFCEKIITERKSDVSQKHKSLYILVIREVSELFGTSNFNIKDLDLDFLYRYRAKLQARKLDNKTVNKRLQTLRVFVNAAISTKIIKPSEDPFLDFEYLKETDKERMIPTPDEIERIEKQSFDNNKELQLTKDLFLFACYTGVREGDLFNLTTDNISTSDGCEYLCYIEHKTGKNAAPRNLSILGNGKPLQILSIYKGVNGKFLFPKISEVNIRKNIVLLRTIIGAAKPWTFYSARHFCLSNLASMGLSPNEVQEFAQHSDLRTTNKYFHSLGLQERIKQIYMK